MKRCQINAPEFGQCPNKTPNTITVHITAGAQNILIRVPVCETHLMGPMAPLFSLDTHGIYGPRIWMLYSDACRCNVTHALALLRSVQMGITPAKTLNAAIDNRGDGLDMSVILSDLQERLPNFAKGMA